MTLASRRRDTELASFPNSSRSRHPIITKCCVPCDYHENWPGPPVSTPGTVTTSSRPSSPGAGVAGVTQLPGVAAASSVLPPRLPTLSAVLLVPGDVRLGRTSCSVATTLLRLRTPTNAEGDGGFVCGDEPSSSSSVGSCPDPDEPEPAPAVSWAGLAPGAGTARRLGLCCCDRFHRTWIPASATERALPVVGVGIMDARRRALPFGRPEDDEDSAERVERGEEVPGGVTGRGVGGGCMSRKYSKHAVIVVMQKLCVGHAVATCRHHIVRRGRPACVCAATRTHAVHLDLEGTCAGTACWPTTLPRAWAWTPGPRST